VDIARHLDALYPDAPAHAFPEPKDASEALWKESEDLMRKMVFVQEGGHGYKLLMPRIPPILDDRGAEHFIRTRKAAHKDNKSPLEWGSPNPEDDWNAMKPSVIAYNKYHLAHSRSASNPGPFFLGDTVSMGDIYLASIVVWFQAAGGDEFVERFLGMGEGEEWEKSPIRGVWDEFETRGWLSKQGEKREIPARCE
jgi:glutathione S-transferase